MADSIFPLEIMATLSFDFGTLNSIGLCCLVSIARLRIYRGKKLKRPRREIWNPKS
jgi:hypothetical protein